MFRSDPLTTNDFLATDRNASNRPGPPPLIRNYEEMAAATLRTPFPGARPFSAIASHNPEHNESDYRRHGISHEQQLEQLEMVRPLPLQPQHHQQHHFQQQHQQQQQQQPQQQQEQQNYHNLHQVFQQKLTMSQSTSDIRQLAITSDLEQATTQANTSTPKQMTQSLYGTLGRVRNRADAGTQLAHTQKRLRNVCVKLFGSNPNLPLVSNSNVNPVITASGSTCSTTTATSTAANTMLANPDLCIPRSSKLLAASVTGTAICTKSAPETGKTTSDTSVAISATVNNAIVTSNSSDFNDPNVIYAEIRRKEPNLNNNNIVNGSQDVRSNVGTSSAVDKYDKYVVEVGQANKSNVHDVSLDANQSSQSLVVKDSPEKSVPEIELQKRPDFRSSTQSDSPVTSSSESGRGTLPGDSQPTKSQLQRDYESKSSPVGSKEAAGQRHRRFEQVQMQLQKILDDCGANQTSSSTTDDAGRARAISLGAAYLDQSIHHRLSVVEESEHSWMSDGSVRSAPIAAPPTDSNAVVQSKLTNADAQSIHSSTCDRPRSRSIVETNSEAVTVDVLAGGASFQSKPINGSARSKRSIGNRVPNQLSQSVEDLADVQSIITEMSYAPASKRQIKGLESMYSEILKLLNNRMSQVKSNETTTRSSTLRRNRFGGSDSSLNTDISRIPSIRPARPHLRSKLTSVQMADHHQTCNGSARRLKQLEQHVLMLTRTVSQLTSELRTCQANCGEMHSLRKEVELLRSRLHSSSVAATSLLHGDDHNNNNQHSSPHAMHVHSGSATLPRKIVTPNSSNPPNRGGIVNGFRRLFVDEAPQIRQFLKKIGCEVGTAGCLLF